MRERRRQSSSPLPGGPVIIAPDLWNEAGNPRQSLTAEETALLAAISSVVRFRKGETIYRDGDPADAVFNVIAGVLKALQASSETKKHIVGFAFPNDLVSLAQQGRYVNSMEAATPAMANKRGSRTGGGSVRLSSV